MVLLPAGVTTRAWMARAALHNSPSRSAASLRPITVLLNQALGPCSTAIVGRLLLRSELTRPRHSGECA